MRKKDSPRSEDGAALLTCPVDRGYRTQVKKLVLDYPGQSLNSFMRLGLESVMEALRESEVGYSIPENLFGLPQHGSEWVMLTVRVSKSRRDQLHELMEQRHETQRGILLFGVNCVVEALGDGEEFSKTGVLKRAKKKLIKRAELEYNPLRVPRHHVPWHEIFSAVLNSPDPGGFYVVPLLRNIVAAAAAVAPDSTRILLRGTSHDDPDEPGPVDHARALEIGKAAIEQFQAEKTPE